MKRSFEAERFCAFCEHSSMLYGDEKCICSKKGVVGAEYCCGSFVYDPLKRRVKTPLPKADFSPEDFAL